MSGARPRRLCRTARRGSRLGPTGCILPTVSSPRSPSPLRSFLALAIAPLVPTASLSAQAETPGWATAPRVEVRLKIDGRMTEEAWADADSLTEFRQREPGEGATATERTVVRILRDDQALYVGIRAWDRTAAGIRSAQLRRDADLDSDDNVAILVDGFHDRRGAFVFATNPRGAMWDAQFSGVDDLNESWNGVWEVAATEDSAGWTAEFRIPFNTLRYHAGQGTTFGFNVRRRIRRNNEEVLWQGYGRSQGLYHLASEGTLAIPGELSRHREVALRPFALAQARADERTVAIGGEDSVVGRGEATAKVGLDAKIALGPALTADLTLNTDFAQVEEDRQVVNLTRFPIFFPEKREFFLESSGIFNFGTPSRATLFYSRRIGLRNGRPVPIIAGARVTGRTGHWVVGALDAQTGGVDDANTFVATVKRDLFQRSYLGAMITQHHDDGGLASGYGLDLDLPLDLNGLNLEPHAWVAGTSTPGVRGLPTAWRLSADFPNDLVDAFVSLYRIDPGFAPAVGFVRRTGIWETNGHVSFGPRPHVLGLRQLDLDFPIPSWDIIADADGAITDSRTWQTASFEWRPLAGEFQSGDQFEVNIQRLFDAPRDTFEIFTGTELPPGRYWWNRIEFQYETSSGRPLSVDAQASWGDFYTGTSRELSLSATWRTGGHLILTADIGQTRVRLPTGRFTALETAGRLDYAFSPRMDLLALVQYNNEDQRVDTQFRFHWIPSIGDDVFLVWSSGYTTDPAANFRFPRWRSFSRPLSGALTLKVVHLLQF